MPRRLPVRPAKVFGNFFVLIVLCLMSFIYYTFVIVNFGPKAQRKSACPLTLYRGLKMDPAFNRLQLFLFHACLVVFLDNDH